MENEYIDLPSHDLPSATKREAKFMNLLNEYLLKYYAEYGNKNLYMELEWWSIFNVHEIVVISRRFWFIKRLVDNDKIDESKIEIHWFSFYESVLMELAIQKNPIEFLTNIIK